MDLSKELKQLRMLRDGGLLSHNEFEAEKSRLFETRGRWWEKISIWELPPEGFSPLAFLGYGLICVVLFVAMLGLFAAMTM